MEPWESLHRLADRQGQRLTPSQARAEGVAYDRFARHLSRLGWVPERRGVWARPHQRTDPTGEAHGALLAVKAPALVTGASALSRYEVLRRTPERVELLLPASRWLAARDGICLHYTAGFAALGSRTMDDTPLALVPRALADYAVHASVTATVLAMSDALRLRLCTMQQLREELAARARFPGRATFRTALQLLAGELTHSGVERLARRMLRVAGARPHPAPLAVRVGGRTIAEVDIAFPDVLYGVEIDGPHHLLAEVAASDRARDRELHRAGWTIDRFLWHELEERPEAFVRDVLDRLEALQSRRS